MTRGSGAGTVVGVEDLLTVTGMSKQLGLEAGTDSATAWVLCLEEGDESLAEMLHQREGQQLATTELIFWWDQIIHALAAIHAAGWVWLDCKVRGLGVGEVGVRAGF